MVSNKVVLMLMATDRNTGKVEEYLKMGE